MLEKESFAVTATAAGMYCLLYRTECFDLRICHVNLIVLFYPLAVVCSVAVSSLRKVLLCSQHV